MAVDPRTPVIIGVGQFLNRVDEGADALEPTALMVRALREAEDDSGVTGVLAGTQVVAAVPVVSWRYRDPGRVVAQAIGADDVTTWYPSMGGNTPQSLVNKVATEIAEGRLDQGVVVGGEAFRSRMAAKRAGESVDWIRQGDDVEADWNEGDGMLLGHPAELARGIMMPTQTYPMFENALRHAAGRTLDEHLAVVGEMWAGFSRVAAANPFAWRRQAYTAAEITTPTADNRIVGFPYTKRMVSNPDVDMSAGIIICSVERAEALGVPRDRWVFPLAGTDGRDPLLSERADFTSSGAIGVAGNRALALAGVGIDDVAHLDVYSCFPAAVQVALGELGIGIDRQLTVYGGLCFAGGPWNNPVSHAISSMVGVLRRDPGTVGLVTANGGHIEKHSFGLYSTEPPTGGFRTERPQAEIDARASRTVSEDFQGPVAIESWTVMHERDGSMARALATTLTADGVRVWGTSDDADTMKRFESDDVAGLPATIGPDGRLGLDD